MGARIRLCFWVCVLPTRTGIPQTRIQKWSFVIKEQRMKKQKDELIIDKKMLSEKDIRKIKCTRITSYDKENEIVKEMMEKNEQKK